MTKHAGNNSALRYRLAWQDGEFRTLEDLETGLPLHSRDLASAVFDGIRVIQAERAGVDICLALNLRSHIARFLLSCASLGLDHEFGPQDLVEATRVLLSAGVSKPAGGLRFFARRNSQGAVSVSLFIRPLEGYRSEFPYRLGVSDQRRNPRIGLPYSIKAMAHYASTRAECMRAISRGFDDVLFCNFQGHIAETSRASIIICRDREAFTPPLSDGVLPGLTRQLFRKLWVHEMNGSWNESSVALSDLRPDDVVLLSSSSLGIAPVAQIGGRHFHSGPLGHSLHEALTKSLVEGREYWAEDHTLAKVGAVV